MEKTNYELKILTLQESVREAIKSKEKAPIVIPQESVARTDTQKVVQDVGLNIHTELPEQEDSSRNQLAQIRNSDKTDDEGR